MKTNEIEISTIDYIGLLDNTTNLTVKEAADRMCRFANSRKMLAVDLNKILGDPRQGVFVATTGDYIHNVCSTK
jgi:hypothetical protein